MNNALSGRFRSLVEAVEYLENRVDPRIERFGGDALIGGVNELREVQAGGRALGESRTSEFRGARRSARRSSPGRARRGTGTTLGSVSRIGLGKALKLLLHPRFADRTLGLVGKRGARLDQLLRNAVDPGSGRINVASNPATAEF
jgi:hypothetical protein